MGPYVSRHRARDGVRFKLGGSLLALLLCAAPVISAHAVDPTRATAAVSDGTDRSAAHGDDVSRRQPNKHKHKHSEHKPSKKKHPKKKHEKKHVKKHVKKKHVKKKKHVQLKSGTLAGGSFLASVQTSAVVGSGAAKPASGFLGPNNVFSVDISRAPLNADSAGIVANLANQVTSHWNGVAAFNGWTYNTSFFRAAAGTPRVTVKFDNCQNKSSTPTQLYNAQGTGAFDNVPIPANAVAAQGTDEELSVWSPSTDQLWEFWRAQKRADGWYACWGGRIDHWSTSTGFFADGTGSSATGLSLSAGNVGLAEMQGGSINHALSLAVVDAEMWNQFSYPAQRSDGWNFTNSPHPIREGMRFRLDPSINVDSLNLTPIARAVAKAAQKYGFIVVDTGGAVALTGESGLGVQAATGIDPWQALTHGVPSWNILANFPWSRLQALPFDYGKP